MAGSANSVCPKARPKARPCFLMFLVNCAVAVCNYVQLISSCSSFSYIFIGFHHSQAFSDAAVAVAQIEPFECLWFEDAAIPMLCDTAEAEPGMMRKMDYPSGLICSCSNYNGLPMDYHGLSFLMSFFDNPLHSVSRGVGDTLQNVRNCHRWQQNVIDDSVVMTFRRILFVMNF